MLSLLLALCLAITPADIPDPVPVGTTILEVHVNQPGQPITTRYDVQRIPKAEYIKKFGPLTDQDARSFARVGYVLHVTTVYIGYF